MLSGHTANLPNDVLLGTGIMMVGSTVIGVTRGAPQFTPDFEIENVDFDGKSAPIYLLDRKFHGEAKIIATLMEMGDSATGNQLAKLEAGSSAASAGSPNVTTITPKTGGAFYASSDYQSNVRLIFERGIGTGTKKYCAILFAKALVKYGPLQGENNKEATVQVEICGRKDMSSGAVSDATYVYELREALP